MSYSILAMRSCWTLECIGYWSFGSASWTNSSCCYWAAGPLADLGRRVAHTAVYSLAGMADTEEMAGTVDTEEMADRGVQRCYSFLTDRLSPCN